MSKIFEIQAMKINVDSIIINPFVKLIFFIELINKKIYSLYIVYNFI